MIKHIIECNYCEADITEEKDNIVINGRIHYCNDVCRTFSQKECEELTNHKNSVKDQVQGECLDCGIVYADPGL
ncbi:MAG: hypothetical protein QQN41_10365 [Nitrosopumilus sp.]